MKAIYRAYERNAALLLASEKWSDGYNQSPITHGKLFKTAATLDRKLLLFFKDQANKVNEYVDWLAYRQALYEVKASRIDAYDVNVIVNDKPADSNDAFISVVFDYIATSMYLGVQAGETVYDIVLGLDVTDQAIQRQVRKQIAQLVGKKILDDGTIVDNPDSTYAISNTTRKNIQESIHTSLMLGEDVPTAAKRVEAVIKNPRRAQLIAQQETATAYTSGLHYYGAASNAVGKEWQDNGAIDICKANTNAGPIPFDQPYPSGDQHPLAHIGCLCYERLIYQNELDANPNLFAN